MESVEVNQKGAAWWAGSPPPPPDAAEAADPDVRQQNKCRRRMTCCVIFSLIVVCGVIAAIVVPTTLASRTSVVSAVTDGSNSNNTEDEERVCNGLASNCYRRVNEIMYATVHNAMAALENQFVVAYNNIYSLEDALEAGFRGLMLDSCLCTGLGVQLCHSTCAIGYRRPVPTFEGIVEFLNNNPNEIVILELQVGADSFEGLYDKMLEAENFTNYMYNHPYRTAPWPIINDLIANNTRLIIFQHDGPDCNAGMCPPGFHNTREFVMETAWNATELEGLMRFNETCVRTNGRKASSFMLSNHFATNSLGLPEQDIAEKVNMAVNIRNRTDACTEMLGRMTNFLAVDYWSIGDTLKVVQEYNKALPAITEMPSMSPMPSTSPSAAPVLPTAPPTKAPTAAQTTEAPTAAQTTEAPTAAQTTESPTAAQTTEAPTAAQTTTVPVSSTTTDESSAPTAGVIQTLLPTGTIVPASTPPTTATAAPVTPPPPTFPPTGTTAPVATTIAPAVVPGTQETFPPVPIASPVFQASPFASPVAGRSDNEEDDHQIFIHNIGSP